MRIRIPNMMLSPIEGDEKLGLKCGDFQFTSWRMGKTVVGDTSKYAHQYDPSENKVTVFSRIEGTWIKLGFFYTTELKKPGKLTIIKSPQGTFEIRK